MIEVQHIFRLFQKIQYKDTVLSLMSISCIWDAVSFRVIFRTYLSGIPSTKYKLSVPHHFCPRFPATILRPQSQLWWCCHCLLGAWVAFHL